MKPASARSRFVFAIMSLTIVLLGLLAIFRSPILSYRNWWGGLVFAPFAIVVGALFFLVMVIRPDKIGSNTSGRKEPR